MGLSEVADFVRNFSVLVRVQGSDPKGLKMRNHAFHHYNSGITTLSASGTLLPGSCQRAASSGASVKSMETVLVLTVASVIEPFVLQQYREANIIEGVGLKLDDALAFWKEEFSRKKVEKPKTFSTFRERLHHLQRTENDRVCFGKSGIHGWGLFASRNILEGEMVREYCGEQVRRSALVLEKHATEHRAKTAIYSKSVKMLWSMQQMQEILLG